MIFIDQGEDKMMTRFFFSGGDFLSEGVLARGGFLQEGSFGQREGGLLEGGFGRRGVWPEEGFCPVPIDNNGG